MFAPTKVTCLLLLNIKSSYAGSGVPPLDETLDEVSPDDLPTIVSSKLALSDGHGSSKQKVNREKAVTSANPPKASLDSGVKAAGTMETLLAAMAERVAGTKVPVLDSKPARSTRKAAVVENMDKKATTVTRKNVTEKKSKSITGRNLASVRKAAVKRCTSRSEEERNTQQQRKPLKKQKMEQSHSDDDSEATASASDDDKSEADIDQNES